MSNRQAQRDAQRERRRQERQRARREVRQFRAPTPVTVKRVEPASQPSRSFPWAWAIVGTIAALLIGAGAFFLIKSVMAPLPGQVFASQGNLHINPGDTHPVYNSNPPTSGWHFPVWPQPGIYAQVLPEEYLLHFQEHAGVVVHYNPDKLPADQVTKLHDLVKRELNKGQGVVVMAPDPNIPQPVALTAWQHLESFDTVSGNESKIEDFIERLECNYDPEGVCGPQHGAQIYPTGTPGPGVATVVSPQLGADVKPAGAMPAGSKPESPGVAASATPAP